MKMLSIPDNTYSAYRNEIAPLHDNVILGFVVYQPTLVKLTPN